MKFLGPLLFALIAALGNTLYVAGQKKSAPIDNPIATNLFTLIFALSFTAIAFPFFLKQGTIGAIRDHIFWIVLSGFGLFIVYIGFNLLYTTYGPYVYPIYAVLSILLTAFILGVVIFHEPFNFFHALALLSAILTVFFFAIAQNHL
ncbi:transporter [Planctomycetota bacterium]|nr:transporter [Planctomycetota bacterium]